MDSLEKKIIDRYEYLDGEISSGLHNDDMVTFYRGEKEGLLLVIRELDKLHTQYSALLRHVFRRP